MATRDHNYNHKAVLLTWVNFSLRDEMSPMHVTAALQQLIIQLPGGSVSWQQQRLLPRHVCLSEEDVAALRLRAI